MITNPTTHRIVVMGVAGSGKTTVGQALAERLGARFVDGDDLHPPENVAKMSAGEPLDDHDRAPWLDAVASTLASSATIVVACSALRGVYRDRLRRAGEVTFVHLDLDEHTALERVTGRHDHFMGAEMVASQFATLEPTHGEPDVIVVAADQPLEGVLVGVAAALSAS